jgi:hypothetical protein
MPLRTPAWLLFPVYACAGTQSNNAVGRVRFTPTLLAGGRDFAAGQDVAPRSVGILLSPCPNQLAARLVKTGREQT